VLPPLNRRKSFVNGVALFGQPGISLTVRRNVVVAFAGALSLVALSSATAADRAVTITAAGFTPSAVTIAAGDSITWRNGDTKVHQVVVDKTPCSLTIQTGASASCTFLAGGKFNYRDPSAVGAKFRGTVTVTGPRTAVTVASSRRAVPFAAPYTLTGVVSSQEAGQAVSVLAQACGQTMFARVGDATTTAGGRWTFTVKPRLNTTYRARWRATESPAVAANVRPSLRLTRARGRFAVRVTAAQSFTRKLVLLQRYRPAVRRWSTLKSVKLGPSRTPVAGTLVTSAGFRTRVRRGWRVRAFLPQPQAGTCYVASTSNTLRIR
jgi:plastocyanin